MKHLILNEERANKIYDLLVSIGGANERDRDYFIHTFCKDQSGCTEWRFIGYLGFGGKYRNTSNKVTCYSEDKNPKRLDIIAELNGKLNLLS